MLNSRGTKELPGLDRDFGNQYSCGLSICEALFDASNGIKGIPSCIVGLLNAATSA